MRLLGYLLLTPIISCSLSQILKLVFNMVLNKQKFKLSSLVADGNYPSSHTAFVTSITAVSWFNTIVRCLTQDSEELWIWVSVSITMLWLIVVRDALGVRYTVQKLCECVSELAENTSTAEEIKQKLDIKSGHRPHEVIAGAVLGLIVASFTSCIYYGWNSYIVIPIAILSLYISVSVLVLNIIRKR
ncbi:MAG: divergent PAP2 family protein [Clostridia bacterium]|nr:divergent PAP2 family protein [Clostridia bacterium]